MAAEDAGAEEDEVQPYPQSAKCAVAQHASAMGASPRDPHWRGAVKTEQVEGATWKAAGPWVRLRGIVDGLYTVPVRAIPSETVRIVEASP